jgi:hypothetical protein
MPSNMDRETGIVEGLWRWPVEAMGGESMPSLRVDRRGVGGDRTHAVLARAGDGWRALTGCRSPGLAEWSAAYPFSIGASVEPGRPPYAQVTSPRSRAFVWGDPRLRCALEDHLGHPVKLHRDAHGVHDGERTVLVTWGDLDPRALRANVHLGVDLDGAPERAILTIGSGVRMRLLGAGAHGGVLARVLTSGRIALGDCAALAGDAALAVA